MEKKSVDNRPIGIFDSGLGGLTVVSAFRKEMPQEDVVYLGDTARVPYGTKSVESIIRFARQDVEFLLHQDVKMILAACNTVSAVALDVLHKEYPNVMLYGVLESGIAAALESAARSIVILGTRATIASNAYGRGIHALNSSIDVQNIACPLFVSLVEEGILSGPLVDDVLSYYLNGLKEKPPAAIVLGCTHYPLLKDAIDGFFAHHVKLIDSAEAAACFMRQKIEDMGIGCAVDKTQKSQYFVTDSPRMFHENASRFLGDSPVLVHKIELDI
ncbi:MAG: glutamate racemase [Lentisphaeria bacterium]